MGDRAAIHTLARRYCQEHLRLWMEDCQNGQLRAPGTAGESDLATALSRYLILDAIHQAVETLTPEDTDTAVGMKSSLMVAAMTADARRPAPPKTLISEAAIEDERRGFVEYIDSLQPGKVPAAEPLPYRRMLKPDQTERLWEEMERRWQERIAEWESAPAGAVHDDLLVFHSDYFTEDKEAILRSLVALHGVDRVFELRDNTDRDYELDLFAMKPRYNGSEGYWTSAVMDWMVYVSHESSISLAGEWLVNGYRRLKPDCDDFRYAGPFSSGDLRGTWEVG